MKIPPCPKKRPPWLHAMLYAKQGELMDWMYLGKWPKAVTREA
jgi:hypothetical protein